MKKRTVINLVMVFLVAGLFLTVSCAKKTVVSDATTVEDQTQAQQEATDAASSGAQTATGTQTGDDSISEQDLEAAKAAAAKKRFENQNIHFEFDSSELSAMAKLILKEKAAWLNDNTNVNIVIEGHCDERGTTEYNLALGERRAKSAMNYLVNLGISDSRIETISYGEEKPLDPASNEEAWRKNRRAEFVIK